MQLQINNLRGDEHDLHLLLTCAPNPQSLKGLERGKSISLCEFRRRNPNMTISAQQLSAGRLYIGYGPFVNNLPPEPRSKQYFGWIEFTVDPAHTKVVWSNLTNVDMTGLPLALGTSNWSLGLKVPNTELVTALKRSVVGDRSAVIDCGRGHTKILAPNLAPTSYGAFEPYLEELCSAEAPLVLTSDNKVTWKGKFCKQGEICVTLKSPTDETLQVERSQFTSHLIYRCDGGTLLLNGKRVNQNRVHAHDGTHESRVSTNSTYRELLVGFHEGYFSTSGPNDSRTFKQQTPFATGHGSGYARVVWEKTDSYGFPYADDNCKVLKTSPLGQLLTLTVLDENSPGGSTLPAPATNAVPHPNTNNNQHSSSSTPLAGRWEKPDGNYIVIKQQHSGWTVDEAYTTGTPINVVPLQYKTKWEWGEPTLILVKQNLLCENNAGTVYDWIRVSEPNMQHPLVGTWRKKGTDAFQFVVKMGGDGNLTLEEPLSGTPRTLQPVGGKCAFLLKWTRWGTAAFTLDPSNACLAEHTGTGEEFLWHHAG